MSEQFLYRQRRRGKATVAVTIDGRTLTFENSQLKKPLVVKTDAIAAVVRVAEVGGDDDVILCRKERVLKLSTKALDANICLVFARPVHFDPFKYDAEKSIGVSARERRRGLDVDAVSMTVEEPDRLAAALAERNIHLVPSISGALRDVIGEAKGQQLARRRDEIARERRRAGRRLVGGGLVVSALAGARLGGLGLGHGKIPVGTVLSTAAVAVLVAIAIAALVPFRRPTGPRPVRDRRGWRISGLGAGLFLGLFGAFGAGVVLDGAGLPTALSFGPSAGVFGGVVCLYGVQLLRRPSPR